MAANQTDPSGHPASGQTVTSTRSCWVTYASGHGTLPTTERRFSVKARLVLVRRLPMGQTLRIRRHMDTNPTTSRLCSTAFTCARVVSSTPRSWLPGGDMSACVRLGATFPEPRSMCTQKGGGQFSYRQGRLQSLEEGNVEVSGRRWSRR